MGRTEEKYVNGIFEQSWWLDLVAPNSWSEILIKNEYNEIIARLPYVFNIKRGKQSITIYMPRLTQTLGPWIKKNDNMVGNKNLSFQKDIINELIDKLPKHKYLKIRLDHSNEYVLPYLWKGYKIIPTYSYRIFDLKDLDAVYNNFSKKVKKNIKSARNKVFIDETTDIERLYKLMDITFKYQNRKYPISKELISSIVRECEERSAGKMLSAIDEQGNIHACSYFVYDENVCYYLISGSDPAFRSSGAQTLILWKGIQLAASVTKEFDFEGSMVEGIEQFFQSFGGKQIINYEIYKLPLWAEFAEVMKPRIKKILGYKI